MKVSLNYNIELKSHKPIYQGFEVFSRLFGRDVNSFCVGSYSLYIRCLLIFIILPILINKSHASPYIFDDNTSTTLVSVASVMGLAFQLSNNEYETLSQYKIDQLIEKELLAINRIPVDNYNNDLATVSDILLGVCLAVPALQIFDGRVSSDWGVYGMMYLENSFITFGTTTIAKNMFREIRPYVYNPEVPYSIKSTKDAQQSFFSGHSALAFASMTFFAETYGAFYPETSNHSLIWLGSMSLASTTALLRVFSGRHFPIDVIVGAAVGIAVGKLIPLLHENTNNNSTLPIFRVSRIASISLNI